MRLLVVLVVWSMSSMVWAQAGALPAGIPLEQQCAENPYLAGCPPVEPPAVAVEEAAPAMSDAELEVWEARNRGATPHWWETSTATNIFGIVGVLAALAMLAAAIVFFRRRSRVRAAPKPIAALSERGAADVFVSFATADAARARALVSDLEKAGVKCWMAPRDIRAGRSYAEEITHAIEAAPAFCVLISNASNTSESVLGEVELARRFRRKMLPVFLDNVEPAKALLYYLSASQWLDLHRDRNEAIRQIVSAVGV